MLTSAEPPTLPAPPSQDPGYPHHHLLSPAPLWSLCRRPTALRAAFALVAPYASQRPAYQPTNLAMACVLYAWYEGSASLQFELIANPGPPPSRRLFARQNPAYAVYVQRQHQPSSQCFTHDRPIGAFTVARQKVNRRSDSRWVQ
jgi:hypothetical protein